jgi:superfamily I DNA and/or RNA helicase/very-short-patch-repair endonuclease
MDNMPHTDALSNSTNEQDTSEQQAFALDSLASVRIKLLDLSGKNALLNYKHPKGKAIRLIDRLPDQMLAALRSEQTLTFISIPEPTEKQLIAAGYIEIDPNTQIQKSKVHPNAEQWAKYLGLATSYDLPEPQTDELSEEQHQNNKLQTLMYSQGLDASLHKLSREAEMAIEEVGTNILYLGIGFLEWYESPASDMPRMAPLFTIPVHLQRSKRSKDAGAYHYSITLKDDGMLTNTTLREKLDHEFGLGLPTIEDETTPENYFEQIQQNILQYQPRWKIRRQATLLLLNFTKQAMFEDLNPDNWPSHANIQDHPLISKFFGTGEYDSATHATRYENEHSIDHIKNIHDQFPLVFDADSSQHSALIDAVNGENLVIEGPPGSGKSQTIANIIAACIANGQKVLFVAEKMAALNVVKDRLDKAGLGNFCLELHSHKTNKQKILHDLEISINAHGEHRSPKDIHAEIARFEDLKEKLHNHANLINSTWAQTGLSLHDIFSKATRYREQLGLVPDNLKIMGINGQNLTVVRQKELFEQADMLREIYDHVSTQAPNGNIANHYWYGASNINLMEYQAETLNQKLEEWTKALTSINHYWTQLNHELDFDLAEDYQLETVWQTAVSIKQLPQLIGGEPLGQLITLTNQTEELAQWLNTYELIHQNHAKIGRVIQPQAITEPTTLIALKEISTVFQQLGIVNSTKLEELAVFAEKIAKTQQQVTLLEQQFSTIRPNLAPSLANCFSISRQGLQEFNALLRLINALPSELWRYRDDIYDNPDIDPLLQRLTQRLQVLTPLHKTLLEHFNLQHLPAPEVLKGHQAIINKGGIFKWFSATWRNAKNAILALAVSTKPDTNKLLALLPNLIQYAEGIVDMDKLNKEDDALQQHYQGIATPIERVIELRKWYKLVRAEYGLGFGDRVMQGKALFDLDRNVAMNIKDYAQQGMAQTVISITKTLDSHIAAFPAFLPLRHPDALLSEPLTHLLGILNSQFAGLENKINGANHTLDLLTQACIFLERHQNTLSTWENMPLTTHLQAHGLSLSAKPGEFSQQLLDTSRNTLLITQQLNNSPLLLRSITAKPDTERYQSIQSHLGDLQLHEEKCTTTSQVFIDLGTVQMKDWAESTQGTLKGLIARNQLALNNPKWLNTWLDYIRLRTKLHGQGLENIVAQLENSAISTKMLNEVVQLAIHHQLANEILATTPNLATFSGMEQMAIRTQFQKYDRNLMLLQRELVAYKASQVFIPTGVSNGKIGEYTELGLIKHNMGLKKPRIAVRSLVKRAGNALQALKPCFMMSPMSVAQYLTPGQFNFDIVIMDEASQIRPEDALGAIARGKSLIVVGDPKQLPPTNFFQKANSDEDNDDDVALHSSESILDTVIPMFKNRRLRWHYRSRHESLIAFSNQHFYDSNLILFPSPFKESDEFGIRFTRVEKGCTSSGRNVEEAKMLVDFTAQQLIEHPDESVGIVAMNAKQSEEIEQQLELLLKENPIFQKAYERNQAQADPLFIKNLENVQGDERDVIIISMTYGAETAGMASMHQRFGPINSDVGWRRLNVLFTRSKKRMHVYSSMDSSHIRTDATSKRGVLSLKAFLAYCETKNLHSHHHTGRPADSDFEIAVMDALAKHGYECEPQLGVSGYRLDLAVRDPGRPGRFLIGVECDGATYHSAKSSRDRDRLRQDILESLGWCIHRIWSTDWFKNPQAQLQPILMELEKRRTPVIAAKTIRTTLEDDQLELMY